MKNYLEMFLIRYILAFLGWNTPMILRFNEPIDFTLKSFIAPLWFAVAFFIFNDYKIKRD